MTPRQTIGLVLDGSSPKRFTNGQLERAIVYVSERCRERHRSEIARELWEEVGEELRLELMTR